VVPSSTAFSPERRSRKQCGASQMVTSLTLVKSVGRAQRASR
jgi:hypothetical protein